MNQGLAIKLVVLCLLLFFVSSSAGFAQGSSFGTHDSWVYKALDFLNQMGLFSNYPSDWVNSGHSLSRLEIAYYIKKSLIQQLEANVKQPALTVKVIETVQELVAEFRKELADLGIKTTDISEISPNLIRPLPSPDNEYQDLDLFLTFKKEKTEKEPFYYIGQYFDLHHQSFLFVPSTFVKIGDIDLLDSSNGAVNIIYQPELTSNLSFLVVRGSLPLTGEQFIQGYYLFPIIGDELAVGTASNSNEMVLALLEEVNHTQQVENIWRFSGPLYFDGFLKLKTELEDKFFVGKFDRGLKIGGMLIYLNDTLSEQNYEWESLPFNNDMENTTALIDLDLLTKKNLPALQINIAGNVSLSSHTSLYGGVDLLYREMTINQDSLWPSNTKASAGVSYHLNGYWTVLASQSLVNSQLQTGWLSTTSLGVKYYQSVTLWLAYQLLNFDDPMVTGALSFRF